MCVNNANPAVKDRVNAVNAMLCNTYGERRLLVNTNACPKFTQCLERQVYNDLGEPDKKVDLITPMTGRLSNRVPVPN